MMADPCFVFVCADPSKNVGNPGGQLTASIELCRYAASKNYHVEIIDTLQSSFPVPSLQERLLRGLNRILKLVKLLNSRKFNGVVIFSSRGWGFVEKILMSLIVRIYNIESIFYMQSGFSNEQVELPIFIRFILRILLSIPKKIGIQGDAWRETYYKIGVKPEKLLVIRNWLSSKIETSPSIDKLMNEKFSFCFVGWLVQEKGVRELFDAIVILSKEFDFKFTFVGDGFLRKELEKNILINNLIDRVNITGWVGPEEVRKQLKESHVFVLPSKAEGFPNALLEAMALGLPAICTNVGAISDSLHDNVNGLLLKKCDSSEIANAMKKYLLTPELIKEHSKESIRIVKEQHDMEKNCKKLFRQFIELDV